MRLRKDRLKLNRRKVLAGLSGVGAATIAGCLGDDDDPDDGDDVDPGDDDDDDDDDDGVDPGDDDDEPPVTEWDDVVMGGTLHTGLSADPPDWDPTEIGDTTSNMVSGAMVYESIVTTDYSGNVHPWLASDWEEIDVQDVGPADYEPYMKPADDVPGGEFLMSSPDGEMSLDVEGAAEAAEDGVYGIGYEFTIRDGVTFHNGEELTAEHFPPSYLRWTNSGRWGVEMVPWFLHIEATGDDTVAIYSQEPDADYFLSVGQQVFPEDHWDLEPGAIDPIEGETPIGTGPWEFGEYSEDEYVVLNRYDDHWFQDHADDFDIPEGYPEMPPIETIDYEVIPDDSTRQAALEDGIIDHTSGLIAENYDAFVESDEYDVSNTTAGGYLFFEYPNQVEPWDDERMCQAVNKLIPRRTITEVVFHGWQEPAWLPLSPVAGEIGSHDYEPLADELMEYSEHDVDEAVAQIEEVFDDYGIEAPYETRIHTNAGNTDRVETVGIIQEVMNGTGLFDVSVETSEWGAFVEMLISGTAYQENQIICVGLSSGWSPDGYARAVSHPDNWHGACCNHTHYENETVTELIDDARYGVDVVGEDNLDTRRDRYEQLWPELLRDPPVSWISFGQEVDVTRESVVNGWDTYPFNSNKYSAALWTPVAERAVWLDDE